MDNLNAELPTTKLFSRASQQFVDPSREINVVFSPTNVRGFSSSYTSTHPQPQPQPRRSTTFFQLLDPWIFSSATDRLLWMKSEWVNFAWWRSNHCVIYSLVNHEYGNIQHMTHECGNVQQLVIQGEVYHNLVLAPLPFINLIEFTGSQLYTQCEMWRQNNMAAQ